MIDTLLSTLERRGSCTMKELYEEIPAHPFLIRMKVGELTSQGFIREEKESRWELTPMGKKVFLFGFPGDRNY